jgi:hypothetical protein
MRGCMTDRTLDEFHEQVIAACDCERGAIEMSITDGERSALDDYLTETINRVSEVLKTLYGPYPGLALAIARRINEAI